MALTACAADAEEPSLRAENTSEAAMEIKGGYPDSGDRAVTGLLITDRNGQVKRTCSSTLLAPNLVLTAQHCIADAPKLIACKKATFGDPVDPGQVYITVGDSLWAPDAPWIVAREVLRPSDGNAVCGRDVALVVLASPVGSSEATPHAPRLDRPPEVSEIYSAVGFGDTGAGARRRGARISGLRHRRDGLIVECVGYGCGTQERVAGSEWRGETGICSGDSGGPALDATGRVIGVTSRGPTGCADPIYGGLIAHREWLMREAQRAAALGGYAPPAWAAPSTAEAEQPSRRPLDARWTSCAYDPAASGASGATSLVSLALVALRQWAARRAARGGARVPRAGVGPLRSRTPAPDSGCGEQSAC